MGLYRDTSLPHCATLLGGMLVAGGGGTSLVWGNGKLGTRVNNSGPGGGGGGKAGYVCPRHNKPQNHAGWETVN